MSAWVNLSLPLMQASTILARGASLKNGLPPRMIAHVILTDCAGQIEQAVQTDLITYRQIAKKSPRET
jgi:hypothetical protein